MRRKFWEAAMRAGRWRAMAREAKRKRSISPRFSGKGSTLIFISVRASPEGRGSSRMCEDQSWDRGEARNVSVVPSGLLPAQLFPNVETLGYSQPSLRDERQVLVAWRGHGGIGGDASPRSTHCFS